jgi:COP9 signalosome complex subunit 3
MPVTKVAKYLGDSVEVIRPYLEQLIDQGYLNATIESTPGSSDSEVLRFFPDGVDGPLGKAEEELHRELLDQTKRTNILVEYVKTADHRASLSKEYIDYLKAKTRKGDGGLEDPMDTSWDAMDQPDEDMMSDLR